MSLTTDVIDRLDALGDTANQIADTLIEKGITGVPGNEFRCALYNYLAAEDLPIVSVGDARIQLPGTSVKPSPQIVEFIHAFDQEEFPELVAEPDLCSRCDTVPAAGECCSSHGKLLCHQCYRRTHFVQVCVEGCRECAAEGLALLLDRAVMVP